MISSSNDNPSCDLNFKSANNKNNNNNLLSAFLKNQKFTAPKDIMRFGGKFFMSPTGTRHLGEMKTSTNDDN